MPDSQNDIAVCSITHKNCPNPLKGIRKIYHNSMLHHLW